MTDQHDDELQRRRDAIAERDQERRRRAIEAIHAIRQQLKDRR